MIPWHHWAHLVSASSPAAAWWRAIVLGLVQGLTEFLPVSSSGHLVVAERLIGVSRPGLVLEVGLHAGTLAAVVWAFRRDLAAMARALTGRPRAPKRGKAGGSGTAGAEWGAEEVLLLAAASVPAAAAGICLSHAVERLFTSVAAVAAAWCLCGLVLLAADRLPERLPGGVAGGRLRLRDALWIGGFQALALVPGLSRSGLTMAAGRWRGLSRPHAARFAFLLAVPATGGALLLQARALAGLPPSAWGPLAAGALAATGTGLAAIRWLLGPRRLSPFGWYCLLLGVAAGLVWMTGAWR